MLSSDYENKLRKETNKLKSAAGWLRGLLKNECKWLWRIAEFSRTRRDD